MTRKYFGTDGIRGKVGESPITPEFVLRLGFAAGEVLARASGGHERRAVLIGKDTRVSGYMLEAALEAGLRRGRRGRDALRTDADASRGVPHPGAAPVGRDRDQCLAQPLPGQRHQVLLRRRRQARRRGRAGDRGRPRASARLPALRRARQGTADRRRGRPLYRVLQEHVPERARPAAACASSSTARTAPATTSPRMSSTSLAPTSCAVGDEPNGFNINDARRRDASGRARRGGASSIAPISASRSTATATGC